MSNYYQGYYQIENREKYRGNPGDCYFRSLWELKLCKFADSAPSVVAWCIEPFTIPYVSPIDNKIHQYIIDFWMQIQKPNGETETQLIEVKPYKQTLHPLSEEHTPKNKKRKNSTLAKEVQTFAVNQAKWRAARHLCHEKDWKFIILTEKELFPKTNAKPKRN